MRVRVVSDGYVAAECDDYASDVTRTIPASGKFNPRQREIYNIVLGAQRAAIAAVKPGALITRAGLYQIAFDYINTHGQDLHGFRWVNTSRTACHIMLGWMCMTYPTTIRPCAPAW